MIHRILLTALCVAALGSAATAQATELTDLQRSWAVATYATSEAERPAALVQALAQARDAVSEAPRDAALLIWRGIIASSLASHRGGLGALRLVREAKETFETAIAIDETALGGGAHTSLGTLYHKVPGWPIAFGSDKKARQHLVRALEIAPAAIDPNYFMGEFLLNQGETEPARIYLERALAAADRPGRALADRGRRSEIHALLAQLQVAVR